MSADFLDVVNSKLEARNAVETDPFRSIHASYSTLLNQVDGLQGKLSLLERENAMLQQQIDDGISSSTGGGSNTSNATNAALKNEARLRDKLERLQEELNKKLKAHQEETAQALATARELAKAKDSNATLESDVSKLNNENSKKEKAIEKLKKQLEEAKSAIKLAEKQYDGLKDTIRTLQKENDVVKDENTKFVDRLVSEKEKASEHVNSLNELIDQLKKENDRLKKENDMLQVLKVQEEQRRNWFITPKGSGENQGKIESSNGENSRKFGSSHQTSIIPTAPKFKISAHSSEATCVRYDSSGHNWVATAGADSTVKVWKTTSGTLGATLRGNSGHVMTACDLGGDLAVGGGSDKTCRVWNVRTGRMIHQLVGHANKITCVRLFGGHKGVISGSADRSLKVWDITRSTYKQTVTLRHSSTSYSVDVGSDSFTTVSGHTDGGLRFWDVRTGGRSAEIEDLHEGAITSVQFHPRISTQVLTNSKDSTLKVVDVRTCQTLHTLKHDDFRTNFSWSTASFSPDGQYVGSISGSNGQVFVWRTRDGSLATRLDQGHTTSAAGFAWGSGGSCGQQVASVDRVGNLVLWA